MRLTDEQVREIKDRTEKATEAPWIRSGVRSKLGGNDCLWVGPDGSPLFPVPIGRSAQHHAEALCDADFIARARTDIPDLLADREAMLLEIAAHETTIRALTAGREKVEAENAKLRRVVDAARWVNYGPTFDQLERYMFQQRNALSALEPTNAPDATDDKG